MHRLADEPSFAKPTENGVAIEAGYNRSTHCLRSLLALQQVGALGARGTATVLADADLWDFTHGLPGVDLVYCWGQDFGGALLASLARGFGAMGDALSGVWAYGGNAAPSLDWLSRGQLERASVDGRNAKKEDRDAHSSHKGSHIQVDIGDCVSGRV